MKTIRFTVSNWPGHLPGQHADIRLTAEDGYRAERSYSIASPPEVSALDLTVERLDDGEVSPFLTGQLQPHDTIQLRGPIGGHFAWSALERRRPLPLVGGGSGIVPLNQLISGRTPPLSWAVARAAANEQNSTATATRTSGRLRGTIICEVVRRLGHGDLTWFRR